MAKLCKADYERLVRSNRRINGVDKNKEGQTMARALFILAFDREPEHTELKDFYSRSTHGHRDSITPLFESKFENANPGRVISSLRARSLEKPSIEEIMEKLASSPSLTLYVRASGDQETLKVYKISYN
jgi:hypothetical protein